LVRRKPELEKTAAFALPLITRLGTHGKLRALVLEPTRELAAQVETALRDYARFTNLRTALYSEAPVTAGRIRVCGKAWTSGCDAGPPSRSNAPAHGTARSDRNFGSR
jgi:hypothetical protein